MTKIGISGLNDASVDSKVSSANRVQVKGNAPVNLVCKASWLLPFPERVFFSGCTPRMGRAVGIFVFIFGSTKGSRIPFKAPTRSEDHHPWAAYNASFQEVEIQHMRDSKIRGKEC